MESDMMAKDIKVPSLRHPEKAHRPDNAQPKKPDWIRVKAPTGKGYKETRDIMRDNKLVTVCEEAGCPNVGECWSQGHATMMIMGEVCTRACSPSATSPPENRPKPWMFSSPVAWRRCGEETGAEPRGCHQRSTATMWKTAGQSTLPRPSAPSAANPLIRQ